MKKWLKDGPEGFWDYVKITALAITLFGFILYIEDISKWILS